MTVSLKRKANSQYAERLIQVRSLAYLRRHSTLLTAKCLITEEVTMTARREGESSSSLVHIQANAEQNNLRMHSKC